MIEPDVIEMACRPAQAIDPPGVALGLHHVPAVKRIAPVLAGLAEEIRRHSGDHLRLKIGGQAKQVGMSPDVGAIQVHEDGDVPDHANRALRTVGAQRLPLLGEEKLHYAARFEIVVEFGSFLLQRSRIAMRQFARPAVPAFQTQVGAQAVEQNEVVEPPAVVLAKTLETGPCLRRCRCAENCARLRTTAASSGGKCVGSRPVRLRLESALI